MKKKLTSNKTKKQYFNLSTGEVAVIALGESPLENKLGLYINSNNQEYIAQKENKKNDKLIGKVIMIGRCFPG